MKSVPLAEHRQRRWFAVTLPMRYHRRCVQAKRKHACLVEYLCRLRCSLRLSTARHEFHEHRHQYRVKQPAYSILTVPTMHDQSSQQAQLPRIILN